MRNVARIAAAFAAGAALMYYLDPVTGRMRVRMVDITSDRYKIARSYMLRLDLALPLERRFLRH